MLMHIKEPNNVCASDQEEAQMCTTDLLSSSTDACSYQFKSAGRLCMPVTTYRIARTHGLKSKFLSPSEEIYKGFNGDVLMRALFTVRRRAPASEFP